MKITISSLNAKNANIWMFCAGSEFYDHADTSFATFTFKEGIAVHELIRKALISELNIQNFLHQTSENGIVFTEDMLFYIQLYLNYLKSIKCKLYVESKIELTDLVPYKLPIYCKPDCFYYDDTKEQLVIIDFIYGYSIVEPYNNWKMILHAIAITRSFNFNPTSIKFVIYQPRAYHPDSTVRYHEIESSKLLEYIPQLEMVLYRMNNGKMETETGNWCKFCKALTRCSTAQKNISNIIDISGTALQTEYTSLELGTMLTILLTSQSRIKEMITSLTTLAESRLQKGETIPGFTFSPVSNRREFIDSDHAKQIATIFGIDFYTQKPKSPSQLEKSGLSKKIVRQLTTTIPGPPKLKLIDGGKPCKLADEVFKSE